MGSALLEALRKDYEVIGTDIKSDGARMLPNVRYDFCNVLDAAVVEKTVQKYRPEKIVHFSAILSGAGEKNPELAQKVNLEGFMNVLNAAKASHAQIFSPSTIAAFGPSTPRIQTPNTTVMRPSSIYGITKVFMELMGEYYHKRYGVDFRSLRLPGIISPAPIHGMGTTGTLTMPQLGQQCVNVADLAIKTMPSIFFCMPSKKSPTPAT